MLQALAERGIVADLLVGTSVGAVNAAFLAGNGTGPDAVDDLATIWTRLRRGDVFPVGPVRNLLALAGVRNSLYSDRGLRRLISAHLTYDRLEDAAIPVHVIATDLLTGQEVALSTGDALSAVLASAAIPGVLPPVQRDGRCLVDGGLANNTAISQAVEHGADRVFVLPTGYPCALTETPRRPIAVLAQSLSLLLQLRLITDVAFYSERAELTVLPPLCPLNVSSIDFGHSRDLIRRARTSSGAFLDGTGSPSDPGRVLALHTHGPSGTGRRGSR